MFCIIYELEKEAVLHASVPTIPLTLFKRPVLVSGMATGLYPLNLSCSCCSRSTTASWWGSKFSFSAATRDWYLLLILE